MENITVNTMIENSDIPGELINAVVEQSGGIELFAEMAPDIARHGVDGGFSGWIYYTETCEFFAQNRKDIMALAEQLAEDLGEGGLLEMVQNFGIFRNNLISIDELALALYAGEGDNVTEVHNVMAWFAAEEVARLYVDLLEN